MDEKSLIKATHVCRFWREALVPFSLLWTLPRFTFEQEQRDLCFLERTKSVPVNVNLIRDPPSSGSISEAVKQSLKGNTHRLASLEVVYDQFEELLIQPLPVLKDLRLVTAGGLPSVKSLAPNGICHLRRLSLKLIPDSVPMPRMGDRVIELLQWCPLLEDAFFRYGYKRDLEFTTNGASTKHVSLPYLRFFTLESPSKMIRPGLFNRLSLPPTCDVQFTVHGQNLNHPWDRGFPTLQCQRHLSDIKRVKIVFNPILFMISTIFYNSGRPALSLIRRMHYKPDLDTTVLNVLDFVGSSDLTRSVETLQFEGLLPPSERPMVLPPFRRALNFFNLKTLVIWQLSPILFLGHRFSPTMWDRVQDLVICPPPRAEPFESQIDPFMKRVGEIAEWRNTCKNPLKSVSLHLAEEDARRYKGSNLSRKLSNNVGSVNVIPLDLPPGDTEGGRQRVAYS